MEGMTELLKQLADKLGTTVEHLWGVLIAQTKIEAQLASIWMNVGLYGFGGLAVLCVAKCSDQTADEVDAHPDKCAAWAYQYADAMLSEREKE